MNLVNVKLGIIALVMALFLLTTSCERFNSIEGNNHLATEARYVESFNKISSNGEYNVYITMDTVDKVEVEAEESLMPYISTEISGQTLVIKTRNHRNLRNNLPMNVYVRVSKINDIEISGSGRVSSDSISATSLDVDISGSGDVDLNVYTSSLDADISGSGNLTLQGTTNDSELRISGSGKISAYDLIQDNCFANISGSGNMYVTVNELLDVKISGSGTIHYSGSPQVKTSISGSGAVIHN